MSVHADIEQWNSDMDAWGLTGEQRTNHLRRLYSYHRRIEELHWRRWQRWDRAEAVFTALLIVAVIVGLVIM